MKGHCTCREITYELTDRPLIVHGCHCRWCQRETGTAFATNALIEASALRLLSGTPAPVDIPSESGKGQRIFRCPTCRVAVWSEYDARTAIKFIRVGTLENPDACPPDIHIFTESKQPWVILPDDVPAVPQFYRRSDVWRPEAFARRAAALEGKTR